MKTTTSPMICKWKKLLHDGEWHAAIDRVAVSISSFATYNPFIDNFKDKSGYCVLSLTIAIWCVDVSRRSLNATDLVVLDPWAGHDDVVRRIVESRGINVVRLIACIGADSDTYGAIGGTLLGALYAHDIQESTYANDISATYKNEMRRVLQLHE